MSGLVRFLRSPLARLGGAGLLALALLYAGVRLERLRTDEAVAEARAESAEREAALAARVAAGRAEVAAAEAVAQDAGEQLVAAIKAREAVEARVRPRKNRPQASGDSGVLPTRDFIAAPRHAPDPLPADDCSILLAAVEAERDAYRDALDAEGALSRRLRTAIAATNEQLRERDLQLQASRAGEVRLERRAHRRGAVIAWSLLGGFAAGVAVERL